MPNAPYSNRCAACALTNMYRSKMKKTLFIVLIFLVISCGQNIGEKQNDSNLIYTARIDFGEVNNRIRIVVLDSLINSLLGQRLNEYKTNDSVKNIAYIILKEELLNEKTDTSGFLIMDSKTLNDSVVVFTVNHIDYYVYKYNWDNMGNEAPPPITGNISGYEGWYKINMNRKTLRISYAQ